MTIRLTGAIEIVLYLVVTMLALLLAAIGVLPETGCVWLAAALLTIIFLSSWCSFGGGRHPCFLFLGLLLVFQGGRLVAFVFGAIEHPMQIDVATLIPIQVSARDAEYTLFLLVLSAILVYAPCRLCFCPVKFHMEGEERWLPALYAFALLTFPFSLYKNIAYLSFIRAHGGYLAIYTDHAEVLQSAGLLVRTVSLMNITAILILFVLERRKKRINFILLLYFALSILDLLIGFRGKFFAQALGLWFVHKLKTDKKFNLLPLAVMVLLTIILAVAVSAFREEKSLQFVSPMRFLAVQGVSLNVTEAAVAFRDLFSRYGANYAWWGFVSGISRPHMDMTHKLWTEDLTVYLNAEAARHGFGTATSYLAELFLFGGLTATVAGSLAIGFILDKMHRISARGWGAVAMVLVLPSLIYLPRVELLDPLAMLVKSAFSIIPIMFFVCFYDSFTRLLRTAYRPANRQNSMHSCQSSTSES